MLYNYAMYIKLVKELFDFMYVATKLYKLKLQSSIKGFINM